MYMTKSNVQDLPDKKCHQKDYTEEDSAAAKNIFKCAYCDKTFNSKNSEGTHRRRKHGQFNNKLHIHCQEDNCPERFANLQALREHLKLVHNYEKQDFCEEKNFRTEKDFVNWLVLEQQTLKCNFMRPRGKVQLKTHVLKNYVCSRSGHFISQSRGERQLKSQGTKKLGHHCTAQIIVKLGKSVNVQYFKHHYKHDFTVKHLFLPGEMKKRIADMLRAIIYEDGHLSILDQLLLPQKTSYLKITCVQDGWDAIRSMKVRGAPAISIVAALSLAVDIYARHFSSKEELNSFIRKSLEHLMSSRPTAVNLQQVVNLLTEKSSAELQNKEINVEEMKERIIACSKKLLETDMKINRNIGFHGGVHISDCCDNQKAIVLTHCNTGSLATAGYGTALGVIRWLHENDHLKEAYCTETRPYNQGARLTAYELVHDNIPATLICDDMVAALMKSRQVTAVVVGADRVVANGDTANKIGTYQIAILAKYHGVPFYVAAPRSTLDFNLSDGSLIPIEERPHSEMTSINSIPIAAEGIKCWNPAFDVTPAELITGGIITECGVFPANTLRNNQKLLTSLQLF